LNISHLLHRPKENSYPSYLYGIALKMVAICLSYSFCVYVLDLFYLSNYEKIILFLVLCVFLGSVFSFLPESFFHPNEFFQPINFRKKIISILIPIGISLLVTIIGFQKIPTVNTFDLVVLPNDSEIQKTNRVEVNEIESVKKNDPLPGLISPLDTVRQGNWDINGNSVQITGIGGESIHFQDYSTNGMNVLLLSGPEAGKISINWNGTNQILDLHNETYNEVLLKFQHVFIWKNLSISRKALIGFLFLSNFIAITFILYLFFFIFFAIRKRLIFDYKLTITQKAIVLLLLLSPIINFSSFLQFQNIDLYKLIRVSSNSLISLDNSSKDNFPNFQVYLKLEQYFKGDKLLFPKDTLPGLKLKELQFYILARLAAVSEGIYDPNLSPSQVSKVAAMKSEAIPPMGIVPFRFVFVLEPEGQNRMICLWRNNDVVYFIPTQKEFDCSQEKQ
jgi:hypothetical protein